MARTVVGMEPAREYSARPPACPPDGQPYFRPISPFLHGLNDLGVLHVELADAPERVAHDGLLRRELGVVRQVLELAVAAPVLPVVRARRRDACRPRLDDLADLAPREVLVELERAGRPPPVPLPGAQADALPRHGDRKSTRLNSSHSQISYAVFCLKKKRNKD